MRRLTITTLSAMALLAAAGSAQAQDINPLLPVEGTREIGLSGNLNFQPNNDYDILGSYGPFLNRNLQVGGQLGILRTDELTDFQYAAFANYHFPGRTAVLPFIGVTVGGTTQRISGNTDTAFSLGLQGGVKYFLSENVAISPRLVYISPTDSAVEDRFSLRLGISVFLR
ncbi:MAG: hypothetical protein OHK0029_15380 [Armatimonadaceae bacterium]